MVPAVRAKVQGAALLFGIVLHGPEGGWFLVVGAQVHTLLYYGKGTAACPVSGDGKKFSLLFGERWGIMRLAIANL